MTKVTKVTKTHDPIPTFFYTKPTPPAGPEGWTHVEGGAFLTKGGACSADSGINPVDIVESSGIVGNSATSLESWKNDHDEQIRWSNEVHRRDERILSALIVVAVVGSGLAFTVDLWSPWLGLS